eukprot:11471178-Karenia_brevis.AAC.1
MDVETQLRLSPPVPDFTQFFKPLKQFNRRLRVACPCCGIHAAGHALSTMGVPTDSVNMYDLQADYQHALFQQLLGDGMQPESILLNLGARAGNLLGVDLAKLQVPVDVLIAGPPCPPWSGQGNRKGFNDRRAHVGCLLACVLENVIGICHEINGEESAMSRFMYALNTHIPEFAWSHSTLDTTQYALPHTRVRVFLRGIRKSLANVVPAHLPPFGNTPLRMILGKFPHTPRTDFTESQQVNLLGYEASIRELVRAGTIQRNSVVVVPADRANDKTYSQSIVVDASPTLTCHNCYLVVMSVADVCDETPDGEREFFRKLADCERLLLQGVPSNVLGLLPPGKAVFACGNAFPVPLIISALHPLLDVIGQKIDLAQWPATHNAPFNESDMKAFTDTLKKKSAVIDKKKWRQAKEKRTAAKRKAARKRKQRRANSSD